MVVQLMGQGPEQRKLLVEKQKRHQLELALPQAWVVRPVWAVQAFPA